MDMLLLWNIYKSIIIRKFYFLAIISGEDSVIPALIGNGKLEEDANQPYGWWSNHTERGVIVSDMILGFPSIVRNVRCLIQCTGSLPKLWQTYNWTN